MNDYAEQIQNLILSYFVPNGQSAQQQPIYKSSQELVAMLAGVIPANQLSDHQIFETLSLAGFSIELAASQDDLAQKQYLWKMYQHE